MFEGAGAVMGAQYLIRKGGYFYRPNSQGYTSSAVEAGRYTLEQATRLTHPNGPDGPRDGLTYHHRSEFPELSRFNAIKRFFGRKAPK